jgi:hypothetical protein
MAPPTSRNDGSGSNAAASGDPAVVQIVRAAFVPLTAPKLTLLHEFAGAPERRCVDDKSLISRHIHFTFVKPA